MAAEGASDTAKVKVKKAQLEKSVRALQQLVAKRSANTNPLFGANSETMTLLFTLSQVSQRRKMKPLLIPLPHPMYDEKSEVCFISKDPQKQYKELLMQKHPVPGLSKVIGLEKLKKNYQSAEQKRALADAFDLFICDANVLEMMPKLLGTVFFDKKKKRPVPVRLRGEDPTEAIKKAMKATTMRIPSGPCIGVRFGRCSMAEADLVANAAAVISHVQKHAPQQLQHIAIQATESPALPIWKRPAAPGELVDLKKYHSDAGSSSASDTGISGASETEDTGDISLSDAGETLSTRDTASEIDTVSELDTQSEIDSQAGDVDQDAVTSKEDLPLVKGLKGKKKRKFNQVTASTPAAAETTKAETAAETMKPPSTLPAKKAKKAKA